mmetsp:Transcript_116907/g.325801  ORF Transcript_116907/g.325801 Transcript_116907/m.325801 type:complete len:234 (+) Transcript_116907:605-1306(+)
MHPERAEGTAVLAHKASGAPAGSTDSGTLGSSGATGPKPDFEARKEQLEQQLRRWSRRGARARGGALAKGGTALRADCCPLVCQGAGAMGFAGEGGGSGSPFATSSGGLASSDAAGRFRRGDAGVPGWCRAFAGNPCGCLSAGESGRLLRPLARALGGATFRLLQPSCSACHCSAARAIARVLAPTTSVRGCCCWRRLRGGRCRPPRPGHLFATGGTCECRRPRLGREQVHVR